MVPKFVRSTVRVMAGYTPGEQPAPGESVIKLNTNENPFPPSPKVIEAIAAVGGEALRLYPNPHADAFRAAAAKAIGVDPDMIMAANGSDDVLAIAVQTFLSGRDKLACPEPTYSLYPVLAKLSDVRYVGVPWSPGYELPTDALVESGAKAIFFANPNAPTGTLVRPARIEQLLQHFQGLVLVDEAYVDFADENCVGLLSRYENLVICRTLSKSYSLAGLRFGFAIAQPQVIAEMNKARDSYPCDALSIAAATAAIIDQPYMHRNVQYVKTQRTRLTQELLTMGWKVLPSQTNFLLATVPGRKAREVYEALKQQGILVRFFDKPGLSDKLRITIGTAEQNDTLLTALRSLTSAKPAADAPAAE